MKLLALDTATENCSAALWVDGQLREREFESPRGHAEHLLPIIDALLAEAGLALSALDALAFGRGPGSFTGVRLAASLAQGLAFGAGLGVVAVSDLRALAQRALDLEPGCRAVRVCNDARMGEVYWADYTTSEGLAQATGAEQVGPPAQLTRAPAGALGVGRGFAVYPQLAACSAVTVPSGWERLLPRAADIVHLALPAVRRGALLSPEQALPIYVRDRVAQPSSV